MTVWMRKKSLNDCMNEKKKVWMTVWMIEIPNKKHYTGQHSHSPKHTHKKKKVCMQVCLKWVCVNDCLCGWEECTPRMTSLLERMREWMNEKKKKWFSAGPTEVWCRVWVCGCVAMNAWYTNGRLCMDDVLTGFVCGCVLASWCDGVGFECGGVVTLWCCGVGFECGGVVALWCCGVGFELYWGIG